MKVISDKQLVANRNNALKGGVKTQTGKDTSKYNSIRHGALSKALLKGETIEAERIQECFIEEYQPVNLIERLLVETMTISYIRLLRAVSIEQDYLSGITDPPDYKAELISSGFDEYTGLPPSEYKYTLISGHEVLMKPEKIEELDRIYTRYIVSCERQFYRSLHELQRVQSLRNGDRPTSMAIDVLNDKEGQ